MDQIESPNVDMLINFCQIIIRVGGGRGEEERAEDNDVFLVGFFICSRVFFKNILFYFRLVLLITVWRFER